MTRVIYEYERTTSLLRFINPSDLRKMKDDSLVIVNRIRIYSKLVEFELKEARGQESVTIINALNEMNARESKHRSIAMGPTMRVGDIKKLFPEYERLPKNSFAVIEE